MKCQTETLTQQDTAAWVEIEFNEDHEDRWGRNWLKLLRFTYLQHRERVRNASTADGACSMQHVMQPSSDEGQAKESEANDRRVPGAWLKDRFA